MKIVDLGEVKILVPDNADDTALRIAIVKGEFSELHDKLTAILFKYTKTEEAKEK